eukprot:11871349-Heterocapsa_arctica.AAC.1
MSQNTNHRSTRIRRKEWLWDEYDEIWGFDNVPENLPDYQMHIEALRDRCERGVPTLLDEFMGISTQGWREGEKAGCEEVCHRD